MKKILLISSLALIRFSTYAQLPIHGNAGYSLQSPGYKFYISAGTDSLWRSAIWGFKIFTSLTMPKDSVALVQSVTSESIAVIDTVTGKFKRVPVSKLFETVQRDSAGYYTVMGSTTDDTPTDIHTIPTTSGAAYSIEATVIAITDDGDNMFCGIKYRGFVRSASAGLFETVEDPVSPLVWTGTGELDGVFQDADFIITKDGNNIVFRVTGETSRNILWKVRYKLITINVSF